MKKSKIYKDSFYLLRFNGYYLSMGEVIDQVAKKYYFN